MKIKNILFITFALFAILLSSCSSNVDQGVVEQDIQVGDESASTPETEEASEVDSDLDDSLVSEENIDLGELI